MKDREIIRAFIKFASENKVKEVDESLYENVKKKTYNLIDDNPEITIDDIIEELNRSIVVGANYLLKSEDIIGSVKSFLNQISDQENYEDLEFQSLCGLLKNHLVISMLRNSYSVSKKAILEAWNGKKRME